MLKVTRKNLLVNRPVGLLNLQQQKTPISMRKRKRQTAIVFCCSNFEHNFNFV